MTELPKWIREMTEEQHARWFADITPQQFLNWMAASGLPDRCTDPAAIADIVEIVIADRPQRALAS